MRNKIIAALLTATFASVVSAQVLYWQVNSDVTISGDTSKAGTTWNYAMLYAYTGTDASTATALTSYLFNSDGTSSTDSTYVDKNYFEDSTPAYANLGTTDYTGYSFYIELVNRVDSTDTGIARSDAISYSNLGSALQNAVEFNNNWSSINALGASATFTAIPEPTSGIMLLVGAAILGLRRKRQQI